MVAVLVTTSGHWQLHSMKFLTTTNTVCTNSKSHVPFTGLIPPFVGIDYYCETASRTTYQNRYYLEDPLWDGQGCGRFSSCCDGGRKPWFCKELPTNVTDNIEMRVCFDEPRSADDVLLETIELYIQ